MLQLTDLEPLLAPLSVCHKCSGTNVELKGISKHLQLDLVCPDCGETCQAIVMMSVEGGGPGESRPPVKAVPSTT